VLEIAFGRNGLLYRGKIRSLQHSFPTPTGGESSRARRHLTQRRGGGAGLADPVQWDMLLKAARSAAFRLAVVLFLGGFAIVNAGFDLSRVFGHPLGNYGFSTDGSRVTGVTPRSPAANAHLHRGDLISLSRNSTYTRNSAYRGMAPYAGSALRVSILAPKKQDIIVTAVPESQSRFPFLFLRQALFIACVLFASILLLRRPGVLTWALFLYSLQAIVPAQTLLQQALLNTPFYDLRNVVYALMQPASTFGLVLFAVTAAHRALRPADKVIIAIGAVLALACGIVHAGQAPVFGIWSYGQTAGLSSAFMLLGYLTPALALARTYRLASEHARARLQWLALGVLIAALAIGVKELLVSSLDYQVIAFLDVVPVTVFATSAYALLSDRIVDVNFVASRALVYGILTSLTVGVIALIDWFVSERLQQVRLGFVVEVCAALALGFAFRNLHRYSDALVDRFVFRSVHEAEVALARLGSALTHAPSRETVDRAVSRDVSRIMSLSSSAVFHLTGSEFVRTASCGWPESTMERLDHGHGIALYLSAEEGPIVPDDIFEQGDSLPHGTARPCLAIPCVERHQLIAFALFGSHESGAHPDAKDVELLRQFMERATTAYEHIAVVESTKENHELSSQAKDLASQVRVLRAENEMLRALLPGPPQLPEPRI
jgi:hypothetical protein